MKIRTAITAILLLLILAVALVFTPFFLPARMQDFAYTELTYTLIAKRLTENAKNEEQKVLMLYDWIEFNLTTINDAKLIAGKRFSEMLLGVAWCDHQGFVLLEFLNKLKMTGRLRDVQAHTTTEVLVNGDWCIFDPFLDFVPYNFEKGKFATIEDVRKMDKQTIYSQKLEASVGMNGLIGTRELIKERFKPNDIRWKNGKSPCYIDYIVKDMPGPLLKTIVKMGYWLFGDWYVGYWLFGDWYAKIFQEKWLKRHDGQKDAGAKRFKNYGKNFNANDAAYNAFFKARNYHLHFRYDKALVYYSIVIKDYPKSRWAIEAEYFKALSLFEAGRYKECITFIASTGVLEEKNQRYSQIAHVAGLCHEALGEKEKAIKNYEASLSRSDQSYTAAKDLFNLRNGLKCGEMRSSEIPAPIRCSAQYARKW
jgi:tetratricopeptide (TPR) repeat protein